MQKNTKRKSKNKFKVAHEPARLLPVLIGAGRTQDPLNPRRKTSQYIASTSVAQLRHAFAANYLSTRQNFRLYNESSFDLTGNAIENMSLRDLS